MPPVNSRIPELKALINGLISEVIVEMDPEADIEFAEVGTMMPPVDFPAWTLLLSYTEQDDIALGGLTETGAPTANGWVFKSMIYTDYSGENAEALEELELLIEAVQTRFRHVTQDDLTLPDGNILETLGVDGSTDPGDGAVGATRVAFKEFEITARTEEF